MRDALEFVVVEYKNQVVSEIDTEEWRINEK